MGEGILGNIHSIESCGTVDGPGIRFVVFTQGCPMRCKYCHNPDTWKINEGKQISVSEVLRRYDGVKEFCRGGITVTGGEPLLQIDFVIELFKAAKEKKIHTALDTSGITFNLGNVKKIDEVLKYTDLVMLDIKHIDDNEHKKLTGHSNENILAFARYLSDIKKPMWVRHVVVPQITFNKEYLFELGKFLSTLKNVTALDVLPYHVMGKQKYNNLGMDYPLDGISPLSKEQALQAREWIMEGYRFKA